MPDITISNRCYPVVSSKSLLESLLEQGEKLPFSCRSGVCHACMLKADSGNPPQNSQQSLQPGKRKHGYFLACQCFPTENMSISLPRRTETSAVISHKNVLSSTVVSLTLSPRHPVETQPGQAVRIRFRANDYKNIYLCSPPSSACSELEMHIHRKMGDTFSLWAYESAAIGHTVNLEVTQGSHFIPHPNMPMILVAQPCSLSPVLSILQSVLPADNRVKLYILSSTGSDIYNRPQIEQLASQHRHLEFQCFQGTKGEADIQNRLSVHHFNSQLVISGTPSFINKLTAVSQHISHCTLFSEL